MAKFALFIFSLKNALFSFINKYICLLIFLLFLKYLFWVLSFKYFLLPITGFANSVASPAIEFRREGLVLGVGAKLFTVAGPVLVYGIVSSIGVG
ncbi:MAG: SpoVA/SpoVAEb family sporulation membrane protein, partial [Clostridia bacterium]|nr:SpoVA/SpoVAEb family sporulation membrane protein [Clostridia bacterium]